MGSNFTFLSICRGLSNRRSLAPIFSSMEASSDCMALGIKSRSSPGYELSLGPSLAKIGRLGAGHNCITQTNTYTAYIYI